VLCIAHSISNKRVTTVAINPSGEWLAFGSARVGQLLVWEWQSETHILKQQGHFFDVNVLAFSPGIRIIELLRSCSAWVNILCSILNGSVTFYFHFSDGQLIATGGDDGKVKLWNTTTGFCFVTFSEHSGPITVQCSHRACLSAHPYDRG